MVAFFCFFVSEVEEEGSASPLASLEDTVSSEFEEGASFAVFSPSPSSFSSSLDEPPSFLSSFDDAIPMASFTSDSW